MIAPSVPISKGPKGGKPRWLFLHKKQMEVFRNPSRYKVVVAGRRWGKTQLSKVSIISEANRPNLLIWYIAPTYQMARQIMWREMCESIPRKWVRKYHETLMIITLINGTIIQLKGADKPDTLRGVGLDYVVLDEFQDMRENTWSEVIRPTLASTGGKALFIGTPKSFNHLHKLYVRGQDERFKAWTSWQFPTISSPFVPDAEIEAARRDMDERSFRQEFEASFETMSNRVYYAFDRKIHVKRCVFNPKRPLWIGMDFNIDPMSAVFIQPYEDHIKIIGEKSILNSNTQEMGEVLDRLWFRHQRNVTIYPDPAGGNREHGRGKSDLDILKDIGFRRLKYRRKHPPVRDRINAVNRMLKAADGTIRVQIDPSCEELIKSLEQTQFKPGTAQIDKKQSVEHMTDALGYPIDVEFPIRKPIYTGASY